MVGPCPGRRLAAGRARCRRTVRKVRWCAARDRVDDLVIYHRCGPFVHQAALIGEAGEPRKSHYHSPPNRGLESPEGRGAKRWASRNRFQGASV